jgi:hypothetical protein
MKCTVAFAKVRMIYRDNRMKGIFSTFRAASYEFAVTNFKREKEDHEAT